jgi:hypothetical protein
MDKNKLELVRQYLSSQFPGRGIEEKYDFDRGAQSFKISQDKGTLLLKVNEDFLDETSPERITSLLGQWDVASLLKRNPKQGLLIGNEGLKPFDRN